MVNCCGLLTDKKEPVPLQSIDAQLEVRDHVATVVSTLNYENKEDKPLEAVFVFPLPGDAAVCHFSAQIGKTHIVAEVKEKQQAREEYDDALSSGQQAFLLEESDESPDIFSLSVGSLPPGESASIRLEYVNELAVQADDGLRFCLPAVLNPRYQPEGSGAPSVQVTSVPASLVPYSLSFSAKLSSPRPISKVESSCSLEPLQYLNSDQTEATVKLAAGHKFDRDVELLIYYKDAHQPSAVVEAGQSSAKAGSLMGDPVVMVSLYPDSHQPVMSSLTTSGEFVFLVDRSGSMGSGFPSRMESAKETLLLLLKSLPVGCYFNIYSFGSRFEHIFPKSMEYTQETLEEALKKVKEMKSDLQGTEILKPLQHIYSKQCIPSHPRQLFVFTDGEVGNTKNVLDLVRKNSNSHRCFSFGIGEGASSALINGMAKEGGGHAQFIIGTERMQPKIPDASEGCVKVKYNLAGHPFESKLHFSLKPARGTGLTVHRLAARTLICSLEMKMRESRGKDNHAKKKVVKLSVQSGVSSSFTAFVAVNKEKNQVIQGPMVHRKVPTARAAACYQPLRSGNKYEPLSSNLSRSRFDTFAPLRRKSPGDESESLSSHLSRSSFDTFAPLRSKSPTSSHKKSGSGLVSQMRKRFSVLRKPWEKSSEAHAAKFSLTEYATLEPQGVYQPLDIIKDSRCVERRKPDEDPLLQLVSLQKASGCWLLDAHLTAAMGRTKEEVEKAKPGEVEHDVWATVLALIWLHGFKVDRKAEWEHLSLKAALWLNNQNASCVAECVAAGNALLGCCVQRDAIGIGAFP